MLHGALVGTVAMLIYVGMGLGQPEPVAYIIAHALKVVGGAAGGLVALKRHCERKDSFVQVQLGLTENVDVAFFG